MANVKIHLPQGHTQLPDFYLYAGANDLFMIQREKVAESSPILREIIYNSISSNGTATVDGVEPGHLDLLIRFIYGQKVVISSEAELQALTHSATHLNMSDFLEQCKFTNDPSYPITIHRTGCPKRGYHLHRLSDLERIAIEKRKTDFVQTPLKKLPPLQDINNEPLKTNKGSTPPPPSQASKPKNPMMTDLRDQLKKRSEQVKQTHENQRSKIAEKSKTLKKVNNDMHHRQHETKPKEKQANVARNDGPVNEERQKIYEEYAKKNEIPQEMKTYYRQKYLDDDDKEVERRTKSTEDVKVRPRRTPQEIENREKNRLSWIDKQKGRLEKRFSGTDLNNQGSPQESNKKENKTIDEEIASTLNTMSKTIADNILLTDKLLEAEQRNNQKLEPKVQQTPLPTLKEGIMIRNQVEKMEVFEDGKVSDRLLVMKMVQITGLAIKVQPTTSYDIIVEVTDSRNKISEGQYRGVSNATGDLVVKLDLFTAEKADFLYFSFIFHQSHECAILARNDETKGKVVPVRGENGIIGQLLSK